MEYTIDEEGAGCNPNSVVMRVLIALSSWGKSTYTIVLRGERLLLCSLKREFTSDIVEHHFAGIPIDSVELG